jgi:hypothetical protein
VLLASAALAMHSFRKQHYVVRLRYSRRLRYRLARSILDAIPFLLLTLLAGLIVAYFVLRRR